MVGCRFARIERAPNGPINEFKAWHGNDTVIGEMVLSLTKAIEDVHKGANPGWLYKFQQRRGLWFSLRHGEAGSLDETTVTIGMHDLKAIVAQYHPRDVYNMDETPFYYRRELKGTLTTDIKREEQKAVNAVHNSVRCQQHRCHGPASFAFHRQVKSSQVSERSQCFR